MLVRVGVTFSVDEAKAPPRNIIHDALETLRAVEIETSSKELSEHYATLIVAVLQREADRKQ